jgi:hypothetical protein
MRSFVRGQYTSREEDGTKQQQSLETHEPHASVPTDVSASPAALQSSDDSALLGKLTRSRIRSATRLSKIGKVASLAKNRGIEPVQREAVSTLVW